MAEGGQSNDQILQELDALSHTMYQTHTSKRRTNSLALPRPTGGDAANASSSVQGAAAAAAARPTSRRMSMSPFRSRPKLDKIDDDDHDDDDVNNGRVGSATPYKSQSFSAVSAAGGAERKGGGIRSWRPIRALSRIGMHRVGCLFSVEVVSAHGLPPSMNGLRLMVAVRKKEARDGAVQTMPARVHHGAADFEEMLFVRCNLYCSGGGGGKGNNKPIRFEPRPFLISALAVEAPELDLGRSVVDLSLLVKESTDKAQHGERVRQWDMAFPLAGKAKGGELAVKMAFQIMEDGGVGLYTQQPAAAGGSSSSSSVSARKQSKTSFSIASPKATPTRLLEALLTPTKDDAPSPDLKGIDDFKLDEPNPPVAEVVKPQGQQKQQLIIPPVAVAKQQEEPEELKAAADDSEFFPEFDIVDKGVEEEEREQHKDGEQPKEEIIKKEEVVVEAKNEEKVEEEEEVSSAAGDEVVKEVVLDSAKTWRLNELEAITNQIKALESMMLGDVSEFDDAAADKPADHHHQPEDKNKMSVLDADEEEVTREFLQLLEQGAGGVGDMNGSAKPRASPKVSSHKSGGGDATCYVSDLGKGLGPIVQTRDGGYLASMNPFDIPVARKELPKLAMHLSRPFLLRGHKLPGGGAEVFQRLCAGGSDALLAKLGALVNGTEDAVVVGKTAEQIAFEGMASAIISARSSNKDAMAASSSAAHSVSLLRTMSAAMSHGRQDRIATGIWNAHDAPVPVDEILAVSLQKMEAMAVEALKVQADMADDKAPFEVSPVVADDPNAAGRHPLDAAAPPEEWATACAGADAVTLLVVIQLRDPLRRYEAVGAPSIVIIQAGRAAGAGDDDEPKFKVANMHLGGLRLKPAADRRSVWDGEKQRLTAMHWLVAYGLGKADRKSRAAAAKTGHDVLWSMSSRVMADMWLKPIRNPDVKITK